MSGAALKVFISYSHKDEEFRVELEEHLALLRREGQISSWHDRKILPGQDWAREIDRELESAELILSLVSSTFIASDYCYAVEMNRALARHQAGEAEVVPILIRPCDWQSAPFAKRQMLPKDGRAVSQWENRDEAWADVASGLRRAVAAIRARRETVKPAVSAAAIFSVPFQRNPFFTGREDVLANLATQLKASGRAALAQVDPEQLPAATRFAISGMGGIGKTQTVVEFAYRHRGDYRDIFFVRAETDAELIGGFAEVATLVGVAGEEKDQLAMAQAARRWFEANGGWLLILDNADTPSFLKPFLPAAGDGHVLITSRAQNFAAHHIETQRLALPLEEEALAFLLRRTLRQTSGDVERQAAAELAGKLGNLPLALEQAAAYLVDRGTSFGAYLEAFRNKGIELLNRADPEAGTGHTSVAVTWSLNFAEVERISPASADLLKAAAVLAPDAIPEELFLEGGAEISPAITVVLEAEGSLALDELVAPLLRYSLLDRDHESRSLRVHRLVQETVKQSLGGAANQVRERAVAALNQVFPQPEFRNWPLCERLLPHLFAVENAAEDGLSLASLLNHGGWYLTERARLAEAQPLFQRALVIRQNMLDTNHPDVAMSVNNLARLYDDQGRFGEAEPLYERSLDIREKALGVDHPDVAVSLGNLAGLYQEQGRFRDAEPLYERSLDICEKAFGADHPGVARSLNNLAGLYHRQGRLRDAELLYERSLGIWEKALGAENPDVAMLINNLAVVYQDQGRLREAEPLYVRSLAIRVKTLGADHPGVAWSLNNLASLYERRGMLLKAEPFYKRALAIWKKVLGDDHPDTAAALSNLADLYLKMGRGRDAKKFSDLAREARKRHEARNRRPPDG